METQEQKGWRSEKIKRPRATVEPYALALKAWFEKQGIDVELGGSYRRESEMVGDLDLVLRAPGLQDTLYYPGLKLPHADWIRWDREGDKIAQGSILLPDGTELHIDIWTAWEMEWGAFLWFITGPMELNVHMRRLALRKNMSLSQNGLFDKDTKEQLDDGSERGVARALGFSWLEPRARQVWAGVVEGIPQVVHKVTGSTGNQYEVTQAGDVFRCTCPGFTYRGACKHVKQVREMIAPPQS